MTKATRPDDRTVYGRTQAGDEIVRYDRASKWFIETPGTRVGRTRVPIGEAARLAVEGVHYDGMSQSFDREVSKVRSVR